MSPNFDISCDVALFSYTKILLSNKKNLHCNFLFISKIFWELFCLLVFFYIFFSCETGRRGKSVAKPAAAKRLAPKGQTGKPLRTPHHLADPHGQSDTYEMDNIVAERMAKNPATGISEKQWHVHWKGYPVSARTWEPLEQLSGCEQIISRFNEERERQEQEYEQQRKKKKLAANISGTRRPRWSYASRVTTEIRQEAQASQGRTLGKPMSISTTQVHSSKAARAPP